MVDARIRASELRSGGAKSGGLEVQVISHKRQRHGPWFGGSLLGQTPEFRSYCHSKFPHSHVSVRFAITLVPHDGYSYTAYHWSLRINKAMTSTLLVA
jgi:hypothetical protein